MSEFMIEIPHSPQECAAAGSRIPGHPRARDLELRTLWGCSGGAHITWIVGDFATEREAAELVPRLLSDTARVIRVERGVVPGEPEPPRR